MSDRTFTIQMNDASRLMTLVALGAVEVLMNLNFETPRDVILFEPLFQLRDLLISAPGSDGQPIQAPGQSDSASQGAPLPQGETNHALRDYFQRDRKGNELSGPPEGAELKTVKIVGTQEMASKTPGKNPFLKVLFTGGQAACFDSLLFPHIVKQTGQEAALYFVKSGNYWNIVGVRA